MLVDIQIVGSIIWMSTAIQEFRPEELRRVASHGTVKGA
jgi:hypothetical protein